MNDKIIRFLEDTGYEGASDEPAALQLLRYFEEEYDVSLLSLLEREWVDEQIEREITQAQFDSLRDFLDDEFLSHYDKAIASIESF